MQTPKEEIRNSLLESAGKLFLRKGFLKTSMREIARDAGVGLANIYNYFSSKDEIFRTVVQPVTLAFEQMAHSHHDSGGEGVAGGDETPAPGAEHRRLGFFNPPAHGVDVHAVRGDHHAPGKAAGDEAGDCGIHTIRNHGMEGAHENLSSFLFFEQN